MSGVDEKIAQQLKRLELIEQKLNSRLNKLEGKKEVLDAKANSFPFKNAEWIKGEEVDNQILWITKLLEV